MKKVLLALLILAGVIVAACIGFFGSQYINKAIAEHQERVAWKERLAGIRDGGSFTCSHEEIEKYGQDLEQEDFWYFSRQSGVSIQGQASALPDLHWVASVKDGMIRLTDLEGYEQFSDWAYQFQGDGLNDFNISGVKLTLLLPDPISGITHTIELKREDPGLTAQDRAAFKQWLAAAIEYDTYRLTLYKDL